MQQAVTPPPPPVNLQTTGYGNMGYQLPQNPMGMGPPETGQGPEPPAWMAGNFAAPWWGRQAPNVGHAMLQQQGGSGYGGGAPADAAPQGPSGMSEEDIMALIKAERERLRSQMQQGQGQAIRDAQYSQDRDWMSAVGRPMGVDPYGNGNHQWSPGELSQQDQEWLNSRQG